MTLINNLTARQRVLVQAYERIAERFGKFDASSGSEGAHYAPAAANPFKPELVCSKCVFFEADEGNECDIVNGPLPGGAVEPNAICKLWVIPTPPTADAMRYELGTMLRDVIQRKAPAA